MRPDIKPWVPTLALAFLAAVLAGCAIFTATRPPAEDRSGVLTAEIQSWTRQAEELERKCKSERGSLELVQEELERWQEAAQTVEQNKTAYDELLSQWETLSAAAEATRAEAGHGILITYTIPPNYDRRCLTYLQGGNKVNTTVSGLLGGIWGKALGNQTQNSTQADIGVIHGQISGLTSEVNEALQAAERSLASFRADGMLMDLVLDSEPTGAGAESQIDFFRLYQSQEREISAVLSDTAWAVKTLECAIPVYGTFLSDSTANSDYLQRLENVYDELGQELSRRGVTAQEILTPEELDSLYQRAVSWSRDLGLAVQNSQIWLESSTRESSLLGTGQQAGMASGNHKMQITWRTTDQKVMYATDPKGDILAFYGFTQNGEPLCFSRGNDYVLFDWQAKDGSALSSTYSVDQTRLLYRFACLIRDERNGFGSKQYGQYQQVY